MSRIVLAAVMMASSLMACSPTSPPPLALPAGCNPLLAGVDCFLPYPSEVFLVDDDSFPSGKRIETSGAAKLLTKTGASADITDFMPADGFSRTPTIVAVLDSPIGDTGLTHIFDDPLESISASSRTLIVDAETGEAIPHLVDLDPPNEEGTRRALLLRPYVRLREMHRYVVVLRNLENEDGVVQAAPEGYRRLRDGVDVDNDPVLSPLAARYATDVFPVLQQAGVDRSTTQLVWDFSTGSDLHAMSDMLRMRELVLSELKRTPPTVTIFVTQENDADDTWRLVSGEITGPSVMDGDGGPGTVLARDVDGRVRLNGTVTFPFIGIVPASVRDAAVPGATVLYGHGFFGGGGEMESGATRGILHEAHAVGFAIDWAGMSSADVGYVVQGVGEVVSESLLFGERVPQGMANWLALTEAITSGAVANAADGRGLRPFRRPTTVGEPGAIATTTDAVVFDAASIDYLGISQGYILGTVMTALNPDVRRIAIQVGGGAFSHMMSRASPFRTYLALLDFSMDNALEKQKLIASYQRGFDRFDPAQYGAYLLQEDLPFGPASQREKKRCLMHIGIGDDQVPNFTSWNQARTVGVPLVTPSVRAVPLLPTVAAPVDGSGLVIWDLGDDDSFYEVAAPATVKTSAHEGVRRRPEARAQLRRFYESGVIENTCGDTGCAFAPQ